MSYPLLAPNELYVRFFVPSSTPKNEGTHRYELITTDVEAVYPFGRGVLIIKEEGKLFHFKRNGVEASLIPVSMIPKPVQWVVIDGNIIFTLYRDQTISLIRYDHASGVFSLFEVSGLPPVVTAVAMNQTNVFVLAEGRVYIAEKDTAKPIQFQLLSKSHMPPIVEMSAGEQHCLFLAEDGIVYGFGDNSSGQLGIESSCKILILMPIRIAVKVAQVVAFLNFSHLRCEDGSVYAAGDNRHGQLGVKSRGFAEKETVFKKVEFSSSSPGSIPRARAVYAGTQVQPYSVIVSEEGNVFLAGGARIRCVTDESKQGLFNPICHPTSTSLAGVISVKLGTTFFIQCEENRFFMVADCLLEARPCLEKFATDRKRILELVAGFDSYIILDSAVEFGAKERIY